MFVSFNFPCHLDWLRLTSTDLDCTTLVSQSAYQVHTACIWRKGGRISPKISTHTLWSTAGGWHSSPCASIVNMLQSHFMGMALLGCNEWVEQRLCSGDIVDLCWNCREMVRMWHSNVLFEHRPIWMLLTSSHVSSWHSLRVATHRETYSEVKRRKLCWKTRDSSRSNSVFPRFSIGPWWNSLSVLSKSWWTLGHIWTWHLLPAKQAQLAAWVQRSVQQCANR